ncbi:chemotaxis protein CheD [Desulfobacter latus]|uniref:Probable chemoreceptor glutamine deamidase CheD n=1 Tax=Desulfobacter latus TaxID=2292 RepID=A0A850T5T5_9BACT|nr:chemotaxis protein CheD [Desulfobacter latus]NWH04295.1 chemotaxis protein CheD [Desulfobacter latus]
MKRIVGVADMIVSNNVQESIVTYSLGSCIGLVIYDPAVQVGGLLHYMLPDSKIDRDKAVIRPFMFADTGIPRLFKSAYKLGAKKQRIKIFVAGGAEILDQKGFFNIGKRNYMALRKIFMKNKVLIDKEQVGGNVNRTVRLDIGTGDIFIKTSGSKEEKV